MHVVPSPLLGYNSSTPQSSLKVAADQAEAECASAVVAAEEADVSAMQRATQDIADEAKAQLNEALPALQAAMESLKALSKADIVEVKSFAKPPPLVQLTMEAVCILRQEKPDWETAKRILGDVNFMRSLEDYNRDNIPDGVIRKLRRYIDDPNFQPDAVAKQSHAAMSLCMWVRAIDVYHGVVKVVQPKRERLAEAEVQLERANEALQSKRAAFAVVLERVSALKRSLAEAQSEQARLHEQVRLG
jgi:dynein heavy chain, axonemal